MPTLPNGQQVSDDQYKQYWTEVFRNDPEMQRIFAQVQSPDRRNQAAQALAQLEPMVAQIEQRRMANPGAPITPQEQQILSQYQQARFVAQAGDSGEKGREFEAEQRAQQLGWTAEKDWTVDFDQGGFRVERENFVNRNKEWLIPAAIGAVGAAGAAGAFGGAAGAAGGSGAAVPAATGTAATTAAGGASSVLPAAASAAGGMGSFYGKALLGLSGDLLNGYFANRGANKAADELNKSAEAQIASYDKALGPYMDPGPLNILKGLAGIPVAGAGAGTHGATAGTPVPGLGAGTTGRTAPPTAVSAGFGVPRQGGTLASMANPQRQAQAQTASSFVRMVNPQGEEDDIPADRVQDAIRMFGARPVGAAGRG